MHSKRRVVQALKLFFLALLSTGPIGIARAEPDARADARSHYERGVRLVEERSYQATLGEFELANQKSPHFAVLYNSGLCQVALGRPLEAVEALTKYLKDGGPEVPAARRE